MLWTRQAVAALKGATGRFLYLAEWMVRLIEQNATGTFNAVGPAAPQTLAQFIDGLQSLALAGITYTWIDGYEWLKRYPLRTPSAGDPGGLTEAIPWVMADGTELGHMRISNRKGWPPGSRIARC